MFRKSFIFLLVIVVLVMPSLGSAPVVGDRLDVKIEDVARQGEGIAGKDGFVIFVPNTAAGDQVKVQVDSVNQNYAIGHVVDKNVPESQPESATFAPPANATAPASKTPGFEGIFAIAGLIAIAYFVHARRQ